MSKFGIHNVALSAMCFDRQRKPICLGEERDEGWLLAARLAPSDLALDHSRLDPCGSGSKSGQLVLPPGISPWLELYVPSEGIARGLTGVF